MDKPIDDYELFDQDFDLFLQKGIESFTEDNQSEAA